MIGEDDQGLLSAALDAHVAGGCNERHELTPILHDLLAVGMLDCARVDFLEAGYQRQRHRLWIGRAGTKNKQRLGRQLFALLIMILERRRLSILGHSDRMDETVGIKDENDGSVAQNRMAREHSDMPQPARHRLDHDFLGIEDRIHNDAEALTADLHHDNEAVIDSPSLALAELENSFQFDQRQQLVAQPQHGGNP